MNIDDIPGTRSWRLYWGKPKDLMGKYYGVDGSIPLKKGFIRLWGFNYDPLDCSDIYKRKTERDPLYSNIL